jgi:hypothetical protein
MYYACDVLQDAIRCSGGSSRATAAATSARAHSHVGCMTPALEIDGAERITGAHWSGPRFFGLTKRPGASAGAEAGR